ncbi:MAG: dethiobiotin synthase [Puniceicoccales bacterium]|jgi:dethiobiotin synthase|nr:dethiobiotin synthase [Puniceicoccales bacterium]
MRTILFSGSGTGVGKTRVTGAFAALLAQVGCTVQVVKAVETGVLPGTPGDALQAVALAAAVSPASAARIAAYTLFSFREALAPVSAARLEGRALSLRELVAAVDALPSCDARLVEGSGGLAAPIDASLADWVDFAMLVRADASVLVVENCLGAIHHARLLAAYCRSRQLPEPYFWLNETTPCGEGVRFSNRENLAASSCRVLAEQGSGEIIPADCAALESFLRSLSLPVGNSGSRPTPGTR